MSTARRQFFRLTLLSAGLLASGIASANAVIDPLLNAQMRKARPAEAIQVIVTFKQSGPVSAQQIAAVKTLGVKKGVYMNRLPVMGVLATPAQVRELAKRKDVVSVYYNARLRYFNLEARQVSGSARVSTGANDFGRAMPYSGRGVTVVVNDSGIDTTHPDLPLGTKVQDNVFAAQNILRNTINSTAEADIVPYTVVERLPNSDLGSGHGNHCAGTVAGTGAASNGKFKGAAPGADLVGYGSGGVLLILDAVAGLDYALTKQFSYRFPIRTVSNSWGTNGKFNPMHPVVLSTYELYKAGIVSVFAAGNDGPGENTHNPYAQAPWVISVGAGEKDGVLTGFSSRGNRGEKTEFETPDGLKWTSVNEPTIVATGVDIISTRTLTGGVLATSAPQDAELGTGLAAYYSHLSGTSMATPHVAGVTALMFEANPKLTPKDVKDILQKTATNMSGRRRFEVGAGHLNAYAAVAMAAGLNRNYGATLKMNREFKTLSAAGQTAEVFSATEIVVPGVMSPNEYGPIDIKATDNVTELTAKVDTYAAQNGTGTSYVRVALVDPNGKVFRSPSSTVPGAFLLGPVTMVTVSGKDLIPGNWKIRIEGSQVQESIFTPEEMIISASVRKGGAATGPSDLSNLSAELKQVVSEALSAELVDAEQASGQFEPNKLLTRFDLAQYLMFAANIRQSLPWRVGASTTSTSKFGAELPTSHAMYAYADAVTSRGGSLRDKSYTQAPVMLLRNGKFDGTGVVTKRELAYSLVQALGDEAVTNTVTPDAALTAETHAKHIQRAITLGFITAGDLGAPVKKIDFTAAILKYNAEYRRAED